MDDVVFGVIPPLTGEPRDSDPLPLAGQETSPLFEFFVPDEGGDFFIRVIALFRDNQPLLMPDQNVPTFQIGASSGLAMASVRPDSGEVSIPGVDGSPVASLRCEREPKAIFLITIADIVENSGDWMLRIQNNEPESLRFFGFSAPRERDTRQPWMRGGGGHLGLSSHQEGGAFKVRNWGTAPLIFDDEPGPIGDPDFGLHLKSLPEGRRLDPHQVGDIIFETTEVKRRGEITHQLSCNDPIEAHATFFFTVRAPEVFVPPAPPPPPPPEKFSCRVCGCEDFLGPPFIPGENCQRGSCEHGWASHAPI